MLGYLLQFIFFLYVSILLGFSVMPLAAKLSPETLGVVVNMQDEHSLALGQIYLRERNIPAENLIQVSLPSDQSDLNLEQFRIFKRQLDSQTPTQVEAYVLLWLQPYRVAQCMSITSAVALGFSTAYCMLLGSCRETKTVPSFNSVSLNLYRDYGIRPAMLLAAHTLAQGEQLIARGIESDASYPQGEVFLLSTSDKVRNVRALQYPSVVTEFKHRLPVQIIQADSLRDHAQILMYVTGLTHVPDINTNRYLPGAVADHLTSSAGDLIHGQQMSSLRWLEAGLTASYGAVSEPCNIPQKFPAPGVFLRHYLAGDPLLLAYWKSVQSPGQGLFVGEPLARPFGEPYSKHKMD